MPTIEQKMTALLVDSGLFEDDAAKVMQTVKDDPVNAAMSRRWSDDVSGYSASLMVAIWISCKRAALEWIDVNYPMAWYRDMFVNTGIDDGMTTQELNATLVDMEVNETEQIKGT